jgi:hypothetical protein
MKNTFFTILVGACCYATTNAQCDKKSTFTSSKTEFLNASKEVQETKEETVNISFDKSSLTILINGGAEDKMTGEIKSTTCSWKLPYKEGSAVMQVLLSDPRGDQKNATITLEGKEGKVSMLLEIEGMPDRKIRLRADSFKEQ